MSTPPRTSIADRLHRWAVEASHVSFEVSEFFAAVAEVLRPSGSVSTFKPDEPDLAEGPGVGPGIDLKDLNFAGITPAGLAMIDDPKAPEPEPKDEPLEGSIEARIARARSPL